MQELIASSLKELSAVLTRVDEYEVQAAVERIATAHPVVCLGSGRVGLGLRFFVMRLAHLGLDAHWAFDDTAPALGADGLFILGNGSGRENHAHHAAARAKEAGAQILVFTASPASPSGTLADLVVRIPAPAFHAADADLAQTRQPMGTLYEQAAVLLYDVMAQMLMQRLGVGAEEMRARHRNYE